MSELVAAALALGLAGSLHCAAMCGPLAVAGCRRGERASLGLALAYLGGRLAAYAALGALLGSAGAGLAHAVPLAWLSKAVLAAVAVGAGWRGVSLLLPARPTRLTRLTRRRPVWHWVAAGVPRRGLGLGLATGVLPCGMLMAAWMLAATAGGPMRGSAVMAVFALASLPGLVIPIVVAAIARGAAPRLPRWMAGLAWCSLALWLALRPVLDAAHAM